VRFSATYGREASSYTERIERNMSRIGKMPIEIPEKVQFHYSDSVVKVEGPKGKLEREVAFSGDIKIENGIVIVQPAGEDKQSRADQGLVRSLLNSMVIGVTDGFSKTLKIVGVGYKAQAQGKKLQMNLGYSHPVNYAVPEGIDVQTPDPNTIIVTGIDKQAVGQCAAEIRKLRKPEPYKGKGVMYVDEHIRRKAGKAAVK
jgi:large subunit ribosomal protein L6